MHFKFCKMKQIENLKTHNYHIKFKTLPMVPKICKYKFQLTVWERTEVWGEEGVAGLLLGWANPPVAPWVPIFWLNIGDAAAGCCCGGPAMNGSVWGGSVSMGEAGLSSSAMACLLLLAVSSTWRSKNAWSRRVGGGGREKKTQLTHKRSSR